MTSARKSTIAITNANNSSSHASTSRQSVMRPHLTVRPCNNMHNPAVHSASISQTVAIGHRCNGGVIGNRGFRKSAPTVTASRMSSSSSSTSSVSSYAVSSTAAAVGKVGATNRCCSTCHGQKLHLPQNNLMPPSQNKSLLMQDYNWSSLFASSSPTCKVCLYIFVFIR